MAIMIEMRGVRFRSVFNASGARGFFGEGYWFHFLWKILMFGFFNWAWTTFVAKTVTFHPRAGNMPLRADGITPREWSPKCVYLGRALQGVTLNAVGLTNRGVPWTLAKGRWQKRREPFFLSFMPVGETREDRLEELRLFLLELARQVHAFEAPFGLQLNLSCPNTGHETSHLSQEAYAWLDEIGNHTALNNMPVLLKVSAFLRPTEAAEIGKHSRLDGFVCSNTIAWKDLDTFGINTRDVFGTDSSPLQALGGGGFSGSQMVPIVCKWIRELRAMGFTKVVIGENGIRRPRHAIQMLEAGANGIGIGSMAIIRPWMLLPTTIAVYHHLATRTKPV